MALKLAEEFRRGNVSRGQARRLSTGQVEIVFVLTDGSAYKTVNRTQAAADWMTKNRVLNRRQFFDGFPQANNSASLHNAALLLLGKHGKLRRRALGGYDWAEDVK